ncbi:RecJ like exonuclease [Halobacteriales archaeon SW_6_65_15]|nr:MAG: RecJ like exonuclease [Halobacteriales archaeon SW_6_65_15]
MTATDEPDSGGSPVVYDLDSDCTVEDVETGQRYHATVNGVVDYGVFVDLSDSVSGLAHESTYDGSYAVGDDLVVELTELGDQLGETVHVEGEVVQIKQTGGPTIFHVSDETGVIPCAAFEDAGVRAYPEVEIDDVVRVTGMVEERDNALQVEVDSLDVLEGEEAEDVHDRLAAAFEERAEPHDVEPLVEWPALTQMFPDLEEVAKQLRRTVLESRPIRVRHHADGDGMCASIPVQLALEKFIEETHQDPEAKRHLFKRLPSKAPFYEMEDVTRDLNFALEDQARHGQKLPLLLMLDNGSTAEDVPAYKNLAHYDIPIVVVDHHHPDPEAVEPYVDAHVNPYLYDEDYRITTGMMCVELARMIWPDITEELRHVPAVAGISDRSKADAMADYVELAEAEGYEESFLQDVGEALDYEAHWLKYDAGRNLINDVLNVGADSEARHRELVEFLAETAEAEAHLYRIDVENHAHRFTYPAPGKTTGEIHDRKVQETGEPVITIGYGPDFAVLRSDGVRLDIPEMVSELNEEVVGGGVSGGGHLVVGSIKFVPGMREEVLDALVEKMADAELDEELQSTTVGHEQND